MAGGTIVSAAPRQRNNHRRAVPRRTRGGINDLIYAIPCVSAPLALVAASAITTSSFAVPRYDGIWSVSIVTKKGDCIASYRYPMRIANGVLANGGDIALDVSGKVAPSGAVRVMSATATTARRHRPARRQHRQRIVERQFVLGLLDRRAAQFVTRDAFVQRAARYAQRGARPLSERALKVMAGL